MNLHDMVDTVVERIDGLDAHAEARALAQHLRVTSPLALELLAYEHLSSPDQEAQRIAAIQLRIVRGLAHHLRWLEQVCTDPALAPELRAGLAALLASLCAEGELLPVIDSEAAVFAEPALLFHALLARLRPWLPPMILALEPEPVLDLLELAIPDYLRPMVRGRFEALWTRFHQLRQLPQARLASVDLQQGDQLARLLAEPALTRLPTPAAPRWSTPAWASPWVDSAGVPLGELRELPGRELAG
jgi:hypothetical protein